MTYRNLQAFLNSANNYTQNHKKEENKFTYVLKKVIKNNKSVWETFIEKSQDIDIEHCAVGEGAVILKDAQGNLEFTKEGLRTRNRKRKALFESEVKVESYFVHEIPEDLTDDEREVFTGFVIQPEPSLELVKND